jgi:uncharacterized protein (DUF433 family)
MTRENRPDTDAPAVAAIVRRLIGVLTEETSLEDYHRYRIEKYLGEDRGEMLTRIAVNPKIHFGKPCIAGTRITVQNVLELLDAGLAFDQIIEDYYPDLTTDDIRACIQYAIALVSSEDIHLSPVAV